MLASSRGGTPRFTIHARQRCKEMGLTTKQVKHAFRQAPVDYPGPPEHGHGNRLRIDPLTGLAIAYAPGSPPVVLTVLWHGRTFVRPGAHGA